jgi:hypothetical protein
MGETMTDHSKSDPRYSACPRVQKMQDLLLVSSFGLWAAVLGLSPVLAFHMLMAA